VFTVLVAKFVIPLRQVSLIVMCVKNRMKKLPRKNKQWAKEAYGALETAWGLLKEEYSLPNEEQKKKLISFAPAIAGLNRGIKDKEIIKKAYDTVLENFEIDLSNKEIGEPTHYSICFLLAYLDTLVSFGIIEEKKSDKIMEILSSDYDINYQE